MKNSAPRPPSGLSAAARRWWRQIVDEYALVTAGELGLLEQAARAWDRAELARQEIAKTGLVVTDRFGQVKASPLANVERDARAQVVTCIRALGLDLVEEPREQLGRPADDPREGR